MKEIKRMSIDEIGRLSDRDIDNLISKFKNLMTYNSSRSNFQKMQVELCYLQRESEIRNIRKEKHKEYLASFRKKGYQTKNSD